MEPDYTNYESVCKEALTNPEIFKTFKQSWLYTYMLEHHWATCEHIGTAILNEMINNYGQIIKDLPWKQYQLNDILGTPKMENRPLLKNYGVILDHYNFSHTTLRYILTSINILKHLKSLGDVPKHLDFVEIGGAYGGLCAILLYTLISFNPDFTYSYTIIDLKDPSRMQRKYLDELKIPNVICSTNENYVKKTYDFLISTYCIGEIPHESREQYIKDLVLPSKHGFLVWNATPIHPSIHSISDVQIVDEVPKLNNGCNTILY
jgi:hypothetical protein